MSVAPHAHGWEALWHWVGIHCMAAQAVPPAATAPPCQPPLCTASPREQTRVWWFDRQLLAALASPAAPRQVGRRSGPVASAPLPPRLCNCMHAMLRPGCSRGARGCAWTCLAGCGEPGSNPACPPSNPASPPLYPGCGAGCRHGHPAVAHEPAPRRALVGGGHARGGGGQEAPAGAARGGARGRPSWPGGGVAAGAPAASSLVGGPLCRPGQAGLDVRAACSGAGPAAAHSVGRGRCVGQGGGRWVAPSRQGSPSGSAVLSCVFSMAPAEPPGLPQAFALAPGCLSSPPFPCLQ